MTQLLTSTPISNQRLFQSSRTVIIYPLLRPVTKTYTMLAGETLVSHCHQRCMIALRDRGIITCHISWRQTVGPSEPYSVQEDIRIHICICIRICTQHAKARLISSHVMRCSSQRHSASHGHHTSHVARQTRTGALCASVPRERGATAPSICRC